jgi:hypothetical protein
LKLRDAAAQLLKRPSGEERGRGFGIANGRCKTEV